MRHLQLEKGEEPESTPPEDVSIAALDAQDMREGRVPQGSTVLPGRGESSTIVRPPQALQLLNTSAMSGGSSSVTQHPVDHSDDHTDDNMVDELMRKIKANKTCYAEHIKRLAEQQSTGELRR